MRAKRRTPVRLSQALLAGVAAMGLGTPTALAGHTAWIVSTGNWSTNANWSNGEPTAADRAAITNWGTATITLPGEVCSNLYVGAAPGPNVVPVPTNGNGAIVMNGGDLTASYGLFIGRYTGRVGTFTLNGGTLSVPALSDFSQLQIGRNYGEGYFYHRNGTVNASLVLYVGIYGAYGRYELHDGVLNSAQTSVGYGGHPSWSGANCATGEFVQVGGTHNAASLVVGEGWDDGGCLGIYTMSGGVLNVMGDLYVAALDLGRTVGSNRLEGVFNLRGGTLNLTNCSVVIGSDFSLGYGWYTNGAGIGTFNFTGGTLTDGPHAANLVIRDGPWATGTLRGHGTVDLSGMLVNNGYVIADGGALELSSFAGVTSTLVNTTACGWYAVNGGRLQLPAIAVPTGAVARTWGDADGTVEPDKVNSLRIAFDQVTVSGALTAELVAPDSPYAPSARPHVDVYIGLWRVRFDGAFSGSYTLEFRYDHAAVGTATKRLRCAQLVNGAWQPRPHVLLPGHRIRVAGLTTALDTPQWFIIYLPVQGTLVTIPSPL